MQLYDLFPVTHMYNVFATGIKFKEQVFKTRKEAEFAMYAFCQKHAILLDCTEYDKHERKYSNHKGIRFYINRI